mgnify:CR=1 FL=1
MIYKDSIDTLPSKLYLAEQIKPFEPGYTLGERAETIEKQEDGRFKVITSRGTVHQAPVVAIAGGLGSFEPRK